MQLRSDSVGDHGLGGGTAPTGEESLIIMQTLLCMLREKNVLSRADIEELCHRVEARVERQDDKVMPCSIGGAMSASSAMQRLSTYLGQKYGGKHARGMR